MQDFDKKTENRMNEKIINALQHMIKMIRSGCHIITITNVSNMIKLLRYHINLITIRRFNKETLTTDNIIVP